MKILTESFEVLPKIPQAQCPSGKEGGKGKRKATLLRSTNQLYLASFYRENRYSIKLITLNVHWLGIWHLTIHLTSNIATDYLLLPRKIFSSYLSIQSFFSNRSTGLSAILYPIQRKTVVFSSPKPYLISQDSEAQLKLWGSHPSNLVPVTYLDMSGCCLTAWQRFALRKTQCSQTAHLLASFIIDHCHVPTDLPAQIQSWCCNTNVELKVIILTPRLA